MTAVAANTRFDSLVDRLAALSPRDSPPSSLRDAEPFLDRGAGEVAAACDGVGVIVGGCLAAVGIATGRLGLLLVAIGTGYAGVVLARSGTLAVVNLRRSRALGTAPTIVSRAVLRMRITPAAERAAAFAAETDGRLGDRLTGRVRRADGTPRSGLSAFATAWRDRFPGFYRSLTLVEAAAEAPPEERERTLDRAMNAVLEGTRERAASAAEALRGPATAVYAFGVLLPLALIGVLPAAGAAGVDATLPAVVIVYDMVLPVALVGAGGWLLSRRPVAFPTDTPTDRTADRRLAVVAGGCAAVAGAMVAGTVLPWWTRPIAVVGLGVGTGLFVLYRPTIAARDRTDAFDESLPDALYLVGRRVSDGVSVERAVADAAEELDGVAGEVFTDAARRQRRLRVDIETAFRGDHGALEALTSRRAESAARLFGVAANAGAPAGRALIETADHLDELRRVETEARRDLGQVTTTLSNTAAFFGPLVGGATVALADSVGTAEALDGSVPETAGIGLAVGWYVLLLSGVLTALSVGLERGLDRPTIGYRTGAALCAATVVYLLSFYAAAAVAGAGSL